jgi:tRNA-modifying protein YgfZ
MDVVHRAGRSAFRVTGKDAQKLLEDVLTARVTAEEGPGRWWALLTPQGKIIAEGLIGWAEGAFWLDVAREAADSFFKRMRLYKLRASVEFEDLGKSHAVGWTANHPTGIAHADPRAGGLGYRVVASIGEASAWERDDAVWQEARIAAGVPEMGPDFGPETVFAHDIGMDILGGIDFDKGCYVGQEVVSRMKHRGTARRRPVIVSGIPASTEAGAALVCDGKQVGAVGQNIDGKAVAIVRVDRVRDPAGCEIAGVPVQLALPVWANYDFAESGDEASAEQDA